MYSQLQHIHNMYSNNLIRINLVIDKDSKSFPSEKDWFNKNYNFEQARIGLRFEMHEDYPALVTNIPCFKIMDIARQMSEGRGLLEILTDFTWVFNLDICEELPINFNVTDLYLIPGENCYYLDRECTNAVVLIICMIREFSWFTIDMRQRKLYPFPTGLRDKFSKKYHSTFVNGSALMISTTEDRETMMGRIRRIIPLYMAEAGISECIYKWEDGCVIYTEDNMNPDDDVIMYIM